ncbi:hypothetical protein M0Q97_13945 [Candidatus Dojkabacteria bacterium]|jgi:hypothetical protein|nr:hypothetical protein [Candidatus Dojkabacteria bacterium]
MKKKLKNIQTFEQHIDKNLNISGVINSKIQETGGLLDRINKLVDFLDGCDESKVSVGDVMCYICGYFGIYDLPEDEIETFD